MYRETQGASQAGSPSGPGPVPETSSRPGFTAADRRHDPRPRPRRMGPLAPAELERLARRYLVLAEAGLASHRPHQAAGAVYALAGILDLLHARGAADRAREAAGGQVPPGLLAELRAALEDTATR